MCERHPIQCANCGVNFWLTEHLEAQRRKDGAQFHCPNGHVNVFKPPPPELERLRFELESTQRSLRAVTARAEIRENNRFRCVAPNCTYGCKTKQGLRNHLVAKHRYIVGSDRKALTADAGPSN